MSFRPLLSSAVTVGLLAAMVVGCGTPKRRKDTTAPPPTTGRLALQAAIVKKDKVLPPATMTPAEIRAALWDIAARQKRGHAGRVLADYHDRAQAAQSLEARYLAAAAIPDEDAAWKAFKAISDDQPKFYWAHAGMAYVYSRWGIRDQAEKELAYAFELGPDITYSYTLRGDLYRRLGEHEQAIRDYGIALRADPTDADARTGLALSRRALGNTAEYEADLTRALTDVPTHYEAAESLAQWYDEQSQLAPARKAWEHVEKLAPRNRTAKLALARLRGDVDPAGAATAYEDAAKLQPLTKVEQEALAALYRKLRRTDQEIESLRTLTKLDPGGLGPWRRLAEIYNDTANATELESVYRSILGIDPQDVPALMGLAMVAEKNTRILDALGFFERARLAGSTASEAEIARLVEACMLPAEPIAATNLNRYYRLLSESLEKIYDRRREAVPGLKVLLKIRITTDGAGKATGAEIVEDTLNDPWLEAHLVHVVRASRLPKLDAGRGFVLDFDLPPVKK